MNEKSGQNALWTEASGQFDDIVKHHMKHIKRKGTKYDLFGAPEGTTIHLER